MDKQEIDRVFDNAIQKLNEKTDKTSVFLNDMKEKIAELISKNYKIDEIVKILNFVLQDQNIIKKYGIKKVNKNKVKQFISKNISKNSEKKSRQTKEKERKNVASFGSTGSPSLVSDE